MPEEKVESIKGLTLTADGNGAVFDVALEDLDTFLAGTVSRWLCIINTDMPTNYIYQHDNAS